MNWTELITGLVMILIQLALFLLLAPLVTAWVRKVKAIMQNRQGPRMMQPYSDLWKLLRKEVIQPATASWIFTITPYVVFVTTLSVALIVPIFTTILPLGFIGDVIALVYILATARFFTALAGLDAGSPFGGLGSSREMSLASIIEPAMMLAIFTAAVTAGSTNLGTIAAQADVGLLLTPAHLFAFLGLFIVAMAETGRIPVDNPATHLELTMIHEAMILEYSGKYLALMEWASSMKLLLFLTLLANVFLPWGISNDLSLVSLGVGAVGYGLKIFALATVMAVIECSTAKLRLFRVPDLLAASFVLSLIALILFYLLGGESHAVL
ncbi:NADH-quinone oxidoreductase subunit H [Candidatus Acetothermia bacterium]|nr:NADH-quinone oxidoreductase subunit H [Candidatus Acetothermia bacterium]MBI3644068.1 NADH-quinone oxidoreductase subunit H [Candidatus Acetothermia bacterium]